MEFIEDSREHKREIAKFLKSIKLYGSWMRYCNTEDYQHFMADHRSINFSADNFGHCNFGNYLRKNTNTCVSNFMWVFLKYLEIFDKEAFDDFIERGLSGYGWEELNTDRNIKNITNLGYFEKWNVLRNFNS